MAVVCLRTGGGAVRRVHFIYLGGPFTWQNWRAVETAKVHEADETIIWCAEPLPTEIEFSHPVVTRELFVPAWLKQHPVKLANVKDLYLWKIMWRWGGLYLDLDTVSIRPAWDLLKHDIVVSSEGHEEHPYNCAVTLGRARADVFGALHRSCYKLLRDGVTRWGSLGPHLLTDIKRAFPDSFDVAPQGVLNGWREGDRSWFNGEPVKTITRVIHLYSSNWMDLFLSDRRVA